jgi:hypothetical protein
MNIHRLGIGNTVFLALNLIAIVVGLVLLFANGPNGPLILLIVGAVGLALKKLVVLLGLEKDDPAKTDHV